MLVQEIMSSPVVTVDAEASLSSAYAVMRDRDIRHLPVVREGRLVGVVTDRDLRLATSALHPHPFSSDARVAEVMVADPVTTGPLEPVEEAARLMRARKIGSLPVVDGERLAGIVTGPDLLDAIVRLTGLTRPGGRLAVQLHEESSPLSRLMTSLDGQGVHIHSVLSYAEAGAAPRVILRVSTLNTHALARVLRTEGFDVVWPPEKTWSF
jgi:acetoin utilization protein AcuB